ncbi:MAG: hypothetical protein KDB21_03820 [Acidimicrobiales bacterium]|nr:hypothetical protein [Acidimicrobiales bacterium]
MSSVVGIGSGLLLDGFALCGVTVVRADGPAAVAAAWDGLGPDVGLVVLTKEAAAALGVATRRDDLLTVVLP